MRTRFFLLAVGTLLFAAPLSAQAHFAEPNAYGLVELPVLGIAVLFGFLTARALRGGRLGDGMALIAWGFLVMAIGHLHMQSEALLGFNLFATVFGATGGQVVWIVALFVTWALTALGFFRIYRASTSI
jgi:hypothetical protein